MAAAARARWGCRGDAEPDPPGDAAACAVARARLARVVGADADGFGPGCPLRRLREPWVLDALDARREAERGQLATFLGPVVPAQTYEAVHAIDRAFAARDALVAARRKREAAAPGGGGNDDPHR